MKTCTMYAFKFIPGFCLLLLLAMQQLAQAQINVQIRIVPPYLSRVSDYASRPDLMMLTLTNTSRNTLQLQLHGSITGDNGVSAIVKDSYRSPRPVELGPLETKNLNANDIVSLFNPNTITYTGISAADINRGFILPEGTYSICVRALDYDTHEPLSPEEPIGCTQFNISNVEPPTIISPANEQELSSLGPQAFPITWSTPPGASPATQYHVRIVEMLTPRNPNDAMQSATTPPFFERTVQGNTLLYGPADPQLTPGRQYALMVQADDPFNSVTYRNGGKSEVYTFTYSTTASGTAIAGEVDNKKAPKKNEETTKQYTTNKITGKLSWAFKASEQNYRQNPTLQFAAASQGMQQMSPAVTPIQGAQALVKSGGQTNIHYMNIPGGTPASYYLGQNPLQAAKSVALAQADPTLNVSTVFAMFTGSIPVKVPVNQSVSPSGVISTSGASSLDISYTTVKVDTGTQRYPLANITVTIRGEESGIPSLNLPSPIGAPGKTTVIREQDIQNAGLRTSGSLENLLIGQQVPNQKKELTASASIEANNVNNPASAPVSSSLGMEPTSNVLATAKTDAEGNFTFQLVNPQYQGKSPYKNVLVTVNADGFEPFEYKLPEQRLNDLTQIDLGEQTLLAKTYRLNPVVTIAGDDKGALGNPGMRIRVYREANEAERYPYLQQEGNIAAEDKIPVSIQGRRYIPVAQDSVPAGGNPVKSYQFAMGRLFYQGSLYVEVDGLSGNVNKKATTVRIIDQKVAPSSILQAKPGYQCSLKNPAVSGQVILSAGENLQPIEGAVLQVTFNEEDRLPVMTGAVVMMPLQQGGSQTHNVSMVSAVLGNSSFGKANYAVNSSFNLVNVAAAKPLNGVAQPFAVTSASALVSSNVMNNTSPSFSFQSVYAQDGTMSEAQIQNKYGLYAVKTDASGNYYIGDLPILKGGASYTVKIVSLPYNYQDMEVVPGNEQTFIADKGVTETRSFSISPEVFNLVGRVVDDKGQGLPYARLHFKESSTYFDAGEAGLFQTSYYAGDHILVIEKEGYIAKEVRVKLGGPAIDQQTKDKLAEKGKKWTQKNPVNPGEEVMNLQYPGEWVMSMQHTNTVQQAVNAGYSFSPAMFGNAGSSPLIADGGIQAPQLPGGMRGPSAPGETGLENTIPIPLTTVFAAQITQTFHANTLAFAQTNSVDLGDVGPLLPRQGKVSFTIMEKNTTHRIEGAEIQLFDTTHVTDAAGQWLYEGFGGQATVTVRTPVGQGYVSLQQTVQIMETGEQTEVLLYLEKGTRVHGQVKGEGQPLAGANINIEGRPYLSAVTGDDGSYEIFLPAGEQTIRAAKTGFFSKQQNKTVQGADLLLDFDLEGGGNKNISTLLGFDIELDKALPDGNGEQWSGRFVHLTPASDMVGNVADQSLSFANIYVNFDADGNAIPQGNQVATDATSLSLKLFGFLPVTFKGDPQIVVKKNAAGKGSISGQLQLAVDQMQGSRGFSFPTDNPIYIALANGAGAEDIEVFREAGSTGATEISLKLSKLGSNDVSMKLYGFLLSVDLDKSRISNTGLSLAGTIHTPALGPISSADITIETFSISKDLRIQTIQIKNDNLPSIGIGNWSAALTNVLFNENGFKLGGKFKVTIPQSGESNVDFSNLSLGIDALYGGQFSFPGEGINVYNIVKLTTGNTPLSFGRVGNTQVYSLAGSANIKFDKLITKEIKIPSFQLQTDGRFLIEAPINYSADLSFAKFKIANLTVSTLSGQVPFISVQGEFVVTLPGLKFNVADIRFKAAANGGAEFSVVTISGELEVAVMKVGVSVGLKENGFEGGGKLGIPGIPFSADVDFHYYKVSGGVDIGASFKAGVVIPIGIVTITKIGGGFSYNSGNGKFMININGGASITGFSTVVSLDPISLTVTDGPVIVGEVGIKIANAFALANARIELNVPGKFFSIGVNAQIDPLKGVATAKVNGLLRIKWDPQESYIFLGSNIDVNLFGFFHSYGEYALGINIDNPKYRNDDIAPFFAHLDNDLYQQGQQYKFSGVYLHSITSLGMPKERAASIDLKIVSGKAWFYSYSDVMLLLNFAANDYRFRLAGGLTAGAEGCIGPGCIGAEFSTCYSFTGGNSNTKGWFLNGSAAGSFEGQIGCHADCNSIGWKWIFPCGGRICIGAHASVDVSTVQGVHFGVGLGSSSANNGCSN
ncbi:hypothetical protein SAMN05216436_12424 [bacterium A37T11]|nr:hypothetical protein SAMN05216436_12424 [bacterium A37T11]